MKQDMLTELNTLVLAETSAWSTSKQTPVENDLLFIFLFFVLTWGKLEVKLDPSHCYLSPQQWLLHCFHQTVMPLIPRQKQNKKKRKRKKLGKM